MTVGIITIHMQTPNCACDRNNSQIKKTRKKKKIEVIVMHLSVIIQY